VNEQEFKMLAEIMETPAVLKKLIEREADNMKAISSRIKQYAPEFTLLAGRGSSDNACIYGQYCFQLITHLPSALSTGSVYTLYKNPPHISRALVVGVSQSGETDDVCETIRRAKEEGAITVGITNSQGSTLAQFSWRKCHLHECRQRRKCVCYQKLYSFHGSPPHVSLCLS